MAFIGNTPTTQSFTPAVDYFSGNGSTTAFTLSRPVASVAQVEPFIENVPQSPSDAFTVSGNTVTFTSAPPSGTNNIYVRYTSPITQVIQPGQGTVQTAQLGNITNIASGNSSLTLQTGTTPTTAMTIDTSQNVGIGTSSPSERLVINDTGKAIIRLLNSGSFAGVVGVDNGGYISGTSGDLLLLSGGSKSIVFGVNSATRAATIDSSGNLRVGDANYNFTAGSSGQSRVTTNNDYCFQFTRKNGTGVYTYFTYNTTDTGTISTNGTTTAYNTTSDYRLKKDIQPMTGALAKVQALRPVTYKWKVDGLDGEGFIAHELAEVVPQCVTGEKDAVETYKDEDGNEQTRPKYQGIDTSFLVATLTAAIQELKADLDATKAELQALKAGQ